MFRLFIRMKAVWLFLFLCLFYTAWMTGFTFIFTECELFPNYGMLADGFADGHLFIQASPAADTMLKDGHRYVFSGPVPALVRLPVRLLFGARIPTGLMIVLFCAGVGTLFALILEELIPAGITRSLSFVGKTFITVFAVNGISLFMVTIPSIHHESITAAMFFLMVAVMILLKMHNRRYRPTLGASIMIGLSLSLSVGCRFSYAYAAVFVFGVLWVGMWKNTYQVMKKQTLCSVILVASIGTVSLFLLLWYNYLRFGAILDFGMANLESLYQNYFLNGDYFRYDHFPYNLWSLFFRVPQIVSEFPYIKIPAYILKVQSVGLSPYFLINTNELTISIFYLMPILVLLFAPCFSLKSYWDNGPTRFVILFGLVVVQVLSVTFTVASIARYYFDFISLMMMMAFIATLQLRSKAKISNGMVFFLGGITLVSSFALPMNAIAFYAGFIDYKSPLLNIFF